MADVRITTVLEGFDQAERSFKRLSEAVKQLGKATDDATKQTDKQKESTDDFDVSLTSLIGRYVGVAAAVYKFVQFLKESFSASMEAREANLRCSMRVEQPA